MLPKTVTEIKVWFQWGKKQIGFQPNTQNLILVRQNTLFYVYLLLSCASEWMNSNYLVLKQKPDSEGFTMNVWFHLHDSPAVAKLHSWRTDQHLSGMEGEKRRKSKGKRRRKSRKRKRKRKRREEGSLHFLFPSQYNTSFLCYFCYFLVEFLKSNFRATRKLCRKLCTEILTLHT